MDACASFHWDHYFHTGSEGCAPKNSALLAVQPYISPVSLRNYLSLCPGLVAMAFASDCELNLTGTSVAAASDAAAFLPSGPLQISRLASCTLRQASSVRFKGWRTNRHDNENLDYDAFCIATASLLGTSVYIPVVCSVPLQNHLMTAPFMLRTTGVFIDGVSCTFGLRRGFMACFASSTDGAAGTTVCMAASGPSALVIRFLAAFLASSSFLASPDAICAEFLGFHHMLLMSLITSGSCGPSFLYKHPSLHQYGQLASASSLLS